MRWPPVLVTMTPVQPEPVIDREDIVSIMFTLTDINANLERVVRLLEDEYGEEEEEASDDDA